MKKKRRNNSYFIPIIIIVFILLLCYVWQHNTIVHLGYASEKKRKEKEALLTLYRELNLKLIGLESPYKIKQNLRRHRIHLIVPGERDVVIIKEARKVSSAARTLCEE